jgi:RNA polymerase sigma factor (sigma-70 family)
MSTYAPPGPAAPDIGELYRSLAKPLEEIVRLDVLYAPAPVVEDACQFAWGRLLHRRDEIRRESALPWLARTAVHEAFKLLRRERQCASLEETIELVGESALAFDVPGADELVESRERLEVLCRLPERQQRLLWLHAFGLDYSEIAEHTGYTRRTVERQLLRARRALRAAGAA